MARGAGADRPIVVRAADAVALRAAAGARRRSLDRDERMRRSTGAARLEALGEFDHLRPKARFAEHCGPRRRRVSAAQEFLIHRLVTAAAVAGGQLARDDEPVMLLSLLAGGGLMAIEAVDAALRVTAHLVFVDDRVLLLRVALGALPGCADEG